VTYNLSADQIETLQRACKLDGWSKTYRKVRISDTTFRLALSGANLSQHTYEQLRDYETRWRMDHPQEKQSA
jgi:hypothetical protein